MNSADPVFLEWRERPSRDTLRRLLEAHQDRVYSLCFQVLRQAQDAEDAAQASLLEIARGVLRVREPRAFNSWMYRVCLNNALNLRRERRRRKDREERSAAMKPTAATDELRDALHDALAGLNDEERALIVEHYFEKETLEDLGARRGVSGVAVWKRIEHAKERMKRALAGAGLAVGMTQMNSVLEATEPVEAPSGLSVETALARKDIARPAGHAAPARILTLAATVVVAAIITAVLTFDRPDKDLTKAAMPPRISKPDSIPSGPGPVAAKPAPPPVQAEASRVVDPEGHSLQGALVFPGRWYRLRGDDAFDLFRPQSIKDGVTTDAEGRFCLETKKPFITAWHDDYSPTTVKATEKVIRMKARSTLKGRLVDAAGKAREGVEITLDKRGPKATTDAEGAFKFEKVIAGYRGLILPNYRLGIAIRIDPGETLNVDIGPGVDVTLDLSGHPKGPGIEVNGGLMGTGRTTSLTGARGKTPFLEVKGIIPGRYLYGEIRRGPRGWVDITEKEAKVSFGSSTLEVTSDRPVSFYLVHAECNEIMEVGLMKDGPLKAGPGETAKVSHLLEGDYELRDLEGVALQTAKIGPGETRIALTSK